MKRIIKAQQTEIDRLVALCTAKGEALDTAVDKFNETLDKARGTVEEARDDYNGALEELKEYYASLVEVAQGYYDERSENWQESDAGVAYSEWISQLESLDLDEIDLDLPDPVDFEVPDVESALPPSEVGG